MLSGQNIVYFSDEWGGILDNRVQLMSVFARHNKVLFVQRAAHTRSTLADFRQGKLRLSDLRRSSVWQTAENLFVFRYPVWTPMSGRPPLRQFTERLRWLCLQDAMRKLQMTQPIVWFYHPKWIDMVKRFPTAQLLVYHVVDEYTSFQDKTPARRRQVAELEKRMMDRADVVVVVSKELYEAKSPFNANTYLIQNGVNYQAYRDALADPYLPEQLQPIKPPRIGYSGLIGDKLNLPMLKDLAHEHPEWSFVFLGPVNASRQAQTWQELQAMPNVHYLGSVAWSEVPHFVKGFDVGLMPYVQNRHSETISPLKLYDYLAAGLPIASIDIPAVREFGSAIHLAASPGDFSQAVQAALNDRQPERCAARRDIAAKHTWEARAEQLSELIQAQLAAKASNGRSN